MPIAEHVVVWAYRIILGREPENAEVVANWSALEDPRIVAGYFLGSPEFQSRRGQPFAPRVLAEADAAALDAWYQLRFATAPPRDAAPVPLELLHEALVEGRAAPEPAGAVRLSLAGREVLVQGPEGDGYMEGLPGEAAALEPLIHTLGAALPDGGEGAVLVDGGANLGLASLAMALAAPRHARLLAFEPNTALHPFLRRNLARNGLARAALRGEALSDRDGEGTLHVPDHNAAVAFLDGAGVIGAEFRRLPVPRVTLDALAEGWDRLDVLKLDLEGSEPAALAGARRTIERLRPLVHVEFNLWPLMRFAWRNPVEVLEEWAGMFPHLVVFRAGRPLPIEGKTGRAWLVHDVLMSDRRFDDLVLCHDLGWIARYPG